MGEKKTAIVVISWWSNCLVLTCLQRLMRFTRDRKIILVQVGKPEEQKKKLRQLLPPGIVELEYPPEPPAEHSRVIRYLVKEVLPQEAGLWFFDHDLFLHGAIEDWLQQVEMELEKSNRVLALPQHKIKTPSITIPLFWVSPMRWPNHLEGFDPVPFNAQLSAKNPHHYSSKFSLRLPRMDTLEQACAFLEKDKRVASFPINEHQNEDFPPFPAHNHIGGLNLFSYTIPGSINELDPGLQKWIQRTTKDFSQFFSDCPKEWLAIEDSVLLSRLLEYQDLINES